MQLRGARRNPGAACGESALDRERCEGLYLKFSEPLMEPHTPVIIERVNGDYTVSKFIIARDEAHELINQLCEFLRVGSPRKVGEDGPSAQEIRLGVHLQHCNFGEYPNACKYGDDDCPALTESWSWFGRALERAARSSSVPVGEQK